MPPEASHTLAEDVGRIAAAARGKHLVLSYFAGDDKMQTADKWIGAGRTAFASVLTVGADLLKLPI